MPKKVLIVDDSLDEIKVMDTILKKAGYNPTNARTGAQALDILKAEKFDLILLDIIMPAVSGYDLLRLLRNKIKHKTKVMFVTIVPEKEVKITDVDGIIQKPFSPKVFIEKISHVMK